VARTNSGWPGQARGQRLIRVDQLSDAGAVPLRDAPRALVHYNYDEAGKLTRVRDTLGVVRREFGWRNHTLVMHRDAAGLQSEYE
jgi:YD repeat-containing protein